jgi:arylsulfatase A-like enzyme
MAEIDDLLSSYATGRLSRGAFIRRLLALGVGMDFIETLLGPGTRRAFAAARGPKQVPSHAPYVVMVVMDAFRADYLDLTSMPNLEWLASRGVSFPRAWVGQLESYTPAGHATLSTGATPAHQGIIGFSWRDPKTGKVDETCWYSDVMKGRLEQQLLQHGVNSIPAAMKAQDPHARVVALSSEKYYAADALGGHAADFIFYGQPVGKKIVTRGIPHHLPPPSLVRASGMTRSWPLTYGQFDEMSMTMALEALHLLDPRLLMINLPGADIYGHRVGGPASPDVMKRLVQAADDQLGRLIKALRDRGIFDQTIFVVTADHGMVGNTYQIDNGVLQAAVKKVGGDLLHFVGGNSGFIWLKNPEAAPQVTQKLVDLFPSLPLYRSTDAAAVSFAFYLTVQSGRYRYHSVAPTGGSVDATLKTAYQYLLGTFAGPTSPDIVLVFQEDMISTLNTSIHGEHGGGTWGAQHIPLMLSGPGIRGGKESTFPARLMDVAPTVLALLGLPPTGMDGVVLADALARPAPAQTRRQDDVAGRLLGYQRAIEARSRADILGQSKATAPPPKTP